MTLRLVAAPDGAVTALDRAIWLTMPFSLAWTAYVAPDLRAYVALSDALVTRLGVTDAATTLLTVTDTGDPHG